MYSTVQSFRHNIGIGQTDRTGKTYTAFRMLRRPILMRDNKIKTQEIYRIHQTWRENSFTGCL